MNYNPEGAAYLQDRWEFEGLVLNAGIRFDLFTPGDQISSVDLRSGDLAGKVDLSFLPVGTYVLELRNADGVRRGRVVKH